MNPSHKAIFYFLALSAACYLFYLYVDTSKSMTFNDAIASNHKRISSAENFIKTTKESAAKKNIQIEEMKTELESLNELRARKRKALDTINSEIVYLDSELRYVEKSLMEKMSKKNGQEIPEFNPTGKKNYKSVRLKSVNLEGISFNHAEGAAKVSFSDMDEKVKESYGINLAIEFKELRERYQKLKGANDIESIKQNSPTTPPQPTQPVLTSPQVVNAETNTENFTTPINAEVNKTELSTRIANIDLRIAGLMREKEMEMEIAFQKQNRRTNSSSKSVLNTANVNRENARKIEAQIQYLEKAKFNLSKEMAKN